MRKTNLKAEKGLQSTNIAPRKNRLPPDPAGTNDLRAAQARAAILEFRRIFEVDEQDALKDLLTNLMHLCDRNPELGAFDAALTWAYRFYEAETGTDAEYARM